MNFGYWLYSKSTRSSPLHLVALQEGNKLQRLHLHVTNAHDKCTLWVQKQKKIDVRQLSHMINTWDICREITRSIICEGGKHKCQRRASMWQTLPGYQNSQTLKTLVKGLIMIPLLSYIFNTTETSRVTHSRMLIILRKNGKIWAKHTKKEKKALFPFTLCFLYHTSS